MCRLAIIIILYSNITVYFLFAAHLTVATRTVPWFVWIKNNVIAGLFTNRFIFIRLSLSAHSRSFQTQLHFSLSCLARWLSVVHCKATDASEKRVHDFKKQYCSFVQVQPEKRDLNLSDVPFYVVLYRTNLSAGLSWNNYNSFLARSSKHVPYVWTWAYSSSDIRYT